MDRYNRQIEPFQRKLDEAILKLGIASRYEFNQYEYDKQNPIHQKIMHDYHEAIKPFLAKNHTKEK